MKFKKSDGNETERHVANKGFNFGPRPLKSGNNSFSINTKLSTPKNVRHFELLDGASPIMEVESPIWSSPKSKRVTNF